METPDDGFQEARWLWTINPRRFGNDIMNLATALKSEAITLGRQERRSTDEHHASRALQ
jgi:hypothetical protein